MDEDPPYFYPSSYGITNAPSSFTQPIDDSNLSPQYLPYHGKEIQDDMDWSPLSPMTLTDVDMCILTDTPPTSPMYDQTPFIRWNTIPQYVPVPPPHHSINAFVASPPVLVWRIPVEQLPPCATQHSYAPSFHTAHWDLARRELPGHTCVSVAQGPLVDFNSLNFLPSTYELPHHAATPQPTSVATLVEEFERSLTLATYSSGAEERSDPSRHCEPAYIIKCPPRTSDSDGAFASLHPLHSNDDPPPSQREATEPLAQDQIVTSMLNVYQPLPPPSEQEPTLSLERGKDRPLPRLETEPAEPLEQGEDQPQSPLPAPRPPTPPLSRRPSKPARLASPNRPAPRLKTDAPVAQASVQASKRTQQQQPRPGARRAPHPPLHPAQALGDKDGEAAKSAARGSPSKRRTALGLVPRPPASVRRTRHKRAEANGEEEKEELARACTKRTRFVVPDLEDDDDEDPVAGTGFSDGTRRTSGPGPLRSILRNKRATPYDTTNVRHVRRASVP